jgi:hypothetical protein
MLLLTYKNHNQPEMNMYFPEYSLAAVKKLVSWYYLCGCKASYTKVEDAPDGFSWDQDFYKTSKKKDLYREESKLSPVRN